MLTVKNARCRNIFLMGLFCFVILSCATRTKIVIDPKTGKKIPLPEFKKEYINKVKNINFNTNILDKYKTAFDISSEYKMSLENIQQHYVLQVENLFSQVGIYFAVGRGDEWFCMSERLSNSVMQLEYINRILGGIKNIEDAQKESAMIKILTDDYMNRFFKQFDKPCYTVPTAIDAATIQGAKTLHDYFETDFSNLFRASKSYFITKQNKTLIEQKERFNYETRLYIDFDAHTSFLGLYLPHTTQIFDILKHLAQECPKIVSDLQGGTIEVEVYHPGLRPVELKDLKFSGRVFINKEDLKFSGRVFIYHESYLFESQIQELTNIYKQHQLYLQFRGQSYAFKRNKQPE